MDEQRMMTAPAFLEIMTRWQPQLAPADGRLTALRMRDEWLPFRQRLRAALDLLSVLDEAVGGARDQLMEQVLTVLHSEILRPSLRLTERQLATVMTTLAELGHETTRATPNTARFCQRARFVVDIALLA